MKKRILSILLAAALVCGMMPMEALATSQTSGSMVVYYNYSSEYTINIPSSISINNGGTVTFSAEKVNIGSGKKVNVTVDGDKTYENGGNFYLYNNKGMVDEKRISCTILRGIPNYITWEPINGLSTLVASFEDGNTSPKAYGALKFNPEVASDTPYGTYTGTIYFKIEVV